MINRKEFKKNAKKNIKEHFILTVIICAIASFVGAEFVGSLFYATANDHYTIDSVVSSVIEKGTEEAKNKIQENLNSFKEKESDVLGRSNGVFAFAVNAVGSGSLYMATFSTVKNIVKSHTATIVIVTIGSFGLYFLFWFYITNIFRVVTRRIFLEGRIYKKVPFRRVTFLRKTKTWNKVSRAMFFKWILQSLWNITVIGGIIKSYSYKMVPYILAENPSMKARDCITLSRNMMYGHKWEAFKLDLSFLLWDILGIITLGVSAIIFSNPYKVATFSEFYFELRKLAKEKNVQNAELLNDTYLFEKADKDIIRSEYEDVWKIIEQEDYKMQRKQGFKYAVLEFLGIHRYTEEEKMYEKQKLKEFVEDEFVPVFEQETYPFRLFTIKSKEKKHRIESLNYLRRYSINSIVFMFFIISFVGWLWEVMLYVVNEGILVNRGTLHGPWLPIYGAGSMLILLLLTKFRKNVPLQFILAVILCGFVEYFTSVFLELTHNGQKWWDYTGYFLNLHGRICAEGLLTFGFGGLAVVYFIAPSLDNWLRNVKKYVITVVGIVLVSLFTIDVIYSNKHPNQGKGINDYTVSEIKLTNFRIL